MKGSRFDFSFCREKKFYERGGERMYQTKNLFTEKALKKAFFSYGSGIPKRTLARFEWRKCT